MNPETQYMGKPCKRGHSGLRWKAGRMCVVCKWTQRKAWRRHKRITDPAWAERQRELKRTSEYRKKDNERRRTRYLADPKYKTKERERQRRVVRMSAGGVRFYLGHAPTVETALLIRESIKELSRGTKSRTEEGTRGSASIGSTEDCSLSH